MRNSAQGLRTRPARTALTAVGIAIGIAAMVGVLGISASSKADLLDTIDSLGTNLLAVQAGQSVFGRDSTLPEEAPEMIRRIPPVGRATAVSTVPEAVRRNPLVPRRETNGVNLLAAETNLVETLQASVQTGRFLDDATARLPAIVLGSVTAERLGIRHLDNSPLVYVDRIWFEVVGILDPLPLNPDLDRAAFIGYPIAADLFDRKADATTIYVRTHPDRVEEVRSVLNRTANPASPNEVDVSRPSDALEAKAAVDANLTRLLVGLGSVALVVGGVGIANVMVISVLERRSEIGLRRALGATRRHVVVQFLGESVMLSFLGGLLGAGLGTAVTVAYARREGWIVEVPLEVLAAGTAAALVVGVLAGLYPAIRAGRLDPAEAVHPA